MKRSPHLLLTLLLLAGCDSKAPSPPPLSPKARLGELIYADRTLSGSGRMSCATCHDPVFTHGPPNAQPVQVGGAYEQLFGTRAAPSIRYLEHQPPFDAARLQGGLMTDGRADTLAAQALLPLFSPRELDAGDVKTVARKVRQGVYGAQFKAVYGAEEVDAKTTVAQIAEALQAFQHEDTRFHPYDSKYDLVLAGREQLTAAEARGLAAFEDPRRGNCASCHTSRPGPDGKPPLFTNFGYAAFGVPRNAAIQANEDPKYFDVGLCLKGKPDQCGFFRTPGLRNTARRPVYFHNGKMTSLAQVLDFYATRDSDAARWYPTAKFDDLRPQDHAGIAPLATITPQDRADIVCFLTALNDGYKPGTPAAENCR
ncbi:cytochrome-c peroxidase [Burkholderiaceae bacterium UC74_6]